MLLPVPVVMSFAKTSKHCGDVDCWETSCFEVGIQEDTENIWLQLLILHSLFWELIDDDTDVVVTIPFAYGPVWVLVVVCEGWNAIALWMRFGSIRLGIRSVSVRHDVLLDYLSCKGQVLASKALWKPVEPTRRSEQEKRNRLHDMLFSNFTCREEF